MATSLPNPDAPHSFIYSHDRGEWVGMAFLSPKHRIEIILPEAHLFQFEEEQATATGRERLAQFRPVEWETRLTVAAEFVEAANEDLPADDPVWDAERLARRLVLFQIAFSGEGFTVAYDRKDVLGGLRYAAYLTWAGVVEWTNQWNDPDALPEYVI